MVLKKPYAFLIKHFRIIHLALVLPIIYLIIRTGNIVHFFHDYINANYYTSISNIAGTYINYFMYLAVIVILITGIFIYFLMKQKEKSTKFYFALIIFYVILLVMIGVSHSILSGMEVSTMEATVARAYRDLSYVFYLPQFFFAAFTIFRGIGFDLKKFNFEIDIKELEITEIDSEEFELTIGIEDYKIKRKIRRFIRELKYYIKENQFIFTILCTIFVIIFGTLIYLNVGVYNKTYRQSQTLTHNNLNIKITGSMLTNRDYSGKVFKDNKYYLVLRIQIENKGKDSRTLDYNNFFVEVENGRVYPILDRASYFIDFAEVLRQDTEILPGSSNSYVLAYEIQEKDIKKEYKLKILENLKYQVGEIAPEYKKISLKPVFAIDVENIKTMNVGKILTFEESNIGYSSMQITNYSITNNFTYQYLSCYTEENCRTLTDKVLSDSTLNTLLVLEANTTIDTSTLYYKSARSSRVFPEHFFTLQYEKEGKSYTIEVKNKTPLTYQNGYILKVPKEVEYADKINLLITIRNKRYIVILK